ncbi:MAG: SET domain-containing protein [Polyangiales bacterium]
MRSPSVSDYELAENAVGLGVFAKRAFPAQAVFCDLEFGPTRSQPWRHSIQIARDAHAEPLPSFLRYLNHSCEPNLFIDVPSQRVVTLRPITVGQELTFFYPSTEWRMQDPFPCKCGSTDCLREIRGASELPAGVLQRYRLSTVIVDLIALGSREAWLLGMPRIE